MEIKFQTKEESNQLQQEAFFKLSKVDRFYSFLNLMQRVSEFPVKNKVDKNAGNFLIIIPSKNEFNLAK